MTPTPSSNSKPLFLKACLREKTERTPVWIMRQAGRYLPEYRKVREKTSFLDLCKTPELAAQVSLQPVELLGVDAAIIFSDILLVPEAMGLKLTMKEKEGPKLFPVLKSASDLRRLKTPRAEKAYNYLGEAIRLVKRSLSGTPLIGFAGSPWTLLTYMVEGGGSREFGRVKKLVYGDPKLAHSFLKRIAEAVTDSLNYQIGAGVQAIQIFDTWGGILTPKAFREFSLQYVERVIGGLRRRGVPVIFFPKGMGSDLDRISRCGADVISLDWTVDLALARKTVKDRVALQGNMDPHLLRTSPARIREAVKEILGKMQPGVGHIFNLGHGILPDTPPEHAKYLVKCVKELSAR